MMTRIDYPNIGETLYCGELPNGLRIRVVPKPGFNSFYAVFGTNYGGAMRRFELDGNMIDTPAGVAHFLEHKMFDLPNGDNALNMLSANGADPNAFTSSGVTCYYFRCTTKFEQNLRLLLHFVSTPWFTPETVEKEQGIIGQEIRMVEDSPSNVLYYNLLKCLYDHHPIRDEVAGTVESIAEISDKTLYDCHKAFYAPSNMILCVEGDVDPEQIYEIAKEELSAERSPVPHADYGAQEGPLPREMHMEKSMEVSMPLFAIGAKISDLGLKDRLIATLSLRLLYGASSPFYSRLYADGILNRDFDADTDYSAGTSMLMFSGESPDPDKVLEEIIREADELRISDEYFERTKKAALGGRLRSLEDFDNVCVGLLIDLIDGYCSFDAPAMFEEISKSECEQFIKENISEEKLAMSVIYPVKK